MLSAHELWHMIKIIEVFSLQQKFPHVIETYEHVHVEEGEGLIVGSERSLLTVSISITHLLESPLIKPVYGTSV